MNNVTIIILIVGVIFIMFVENRAVSLGFFTATSSLTAQIARFRRQYARDLASLE